jgi:GTPase SAR1 family protein
LKASLGNECVICIVGNKCDLEKNRNVSLTEAQDYADSVGAQHFSTSAKLNQGVNELFLDITKSKYIKMNQIMHLIASFNRFDSKRIHRNGTKVRLKPDI